MQNKEQRLIESPVNHVIVSLELCRHDGLEKEAEVVLLSPTIKSDLL